jgi:hypothetical protein
MRNFKTPLLDFVQKRFISLLQPLYNQQLESRAEIVSLIHDSLTRSAEVERQLDSVTESILQSRWLLNLGDLATRLEAGHWLNSLGLTGNGVEVGVLMGEYSSVLLRTWKCASLTSVDPWREFSSTEYVDICNLPQTQHDRNFEHATRRLARFGERSHILRTTSAEAAAHFSDNSLDFVYLDAQHHYEAVRDDIALWLPKVRHGGVIGGHDYIDGDRPSGRYGVKQAVSEMVAANRLTLVVTREPDWPSWFARRA